MALLVSRNAVFDVVKTGGGIKATQKGSLKCDGVLSAACASKDMLYYISKEDASKIKKWRPDAEEDEVVVTLSQPARKIVTFNNKIFCALQTGNCIIAVDPLNLSVEELDTHHHFVDFQPADHGFVLEGDQGDLLGYHFNYGTTKVEGVEDALLLGSYKRLAVALAPQRGHTIGVGEKGDIISDDRVPARITGPFATVDGDVVFYDRKEKNLVDLRSGSACPLPVSVDAEHASVILLTVPESSEEEMCTLCFCEFEGEGDGITLDCGHRFHTDCVSQWVNRWDEFKAKGNHVVFTNAVCPGGCKHLVRHPLLQPLSASIQAMFDKVTKQSKKILQTMPPTKVEDDLLFYVCCKCSQPFYGGEKICFRAQGGEPSKSPSDLVCEGCKDDFCCSHHKREFVVYKCSYCCNPATELSFGNRYLCERCSARWTTTTEPDAIPCPGDSLCPLGGGDHPEKAFPIGCLLCLPDSAIVRERIASAPQKDVSQPLPQ